MKESPRAQDSLESLVWQWEHDGSLVEGSQLRRRMEVLDRLDACFPEAEDAGAGSELMEAGLHRRARSLAARLEAANAELYESIRGEILEGSRPASLLQLTEKAAWCDGQFRPPHGAGYDFLDELISGVLQFDEPAERLAVPGPEAVFYQPTPARHIFSLIRLAGLAVNDVLIDLGSGLGHVPLMVSACTGARAIGVELEPSYVACARRCSERLHLGRVSFVEQDAREADLSSGTVFYLYTPFTGATLHVVLNSIKKQAADRQIKVCTFGPCVATVAEERWLKALTGPDKDEITVFVSGLRAVSRTPAPRRGDGKLERFLCRSIRICFLPSVASPKFIA